MSVRDLQFTELERKEFPASNLIPHAVKPFDERLRSLAYYDVLTGLPNRTLFQDRLASTIQHAHVSSKKLALMFIDLDHFKHVNDSLGHVAGDKLLIQLSERLTTAIRSSDTLARIGGDEFVIILPDINQEQDVVDIAQRIFQKIQAPIDISGTPFQVTLSLGISLFPNDGITADDLLKKGDSAMYQAKSQGRNGYVFYNQHLAETSLQS